MGGCTSSESGPSVPSITISLNAQASGSESALYEKIHKLIDGSADAHIESLTAYKGCDEYIKQALTEPNPESEQAAWKAVEKSVDQLYKFYKFATSLQEILPELLKTVCGTGPESAEESVQGSQALCKQLAQIFDFAFHFDDLKMVNPAIQNDFSYFRRVYIRMRNAAEKDKKKKSKTKVNEEVANKMSFHFAYPTPVMKALIDTVTQTPGSTSFVHGLSVVANVCCSMVENNQVEGTADKMLLLCGMTGCIIFVDHLEPLGVFQKKSPIRIKQCITLLKNFTEQSTMFLLNSLRFTTLHLADDHTMPAISKLLAP